MIEDILEKAICVNEVERAILLTRLAETSEIALKELAELLSRPAKHLWQVALQAVHAIGYPGNTSIIPLVVEHLVDGNWPGWKDAIDILMDVPSSIITPLLIEILLDQGRKRVLWCDDVEGICTALSQMGEEYITPCIPSILFILSRKEGQNEPDPEIVLRVLECANFYHYAYVLPVLIHLSNTAKQEETRIYVQKLVQQFPSKDLELYKQVLSLPLS